MTSEYNREGPFEINDIGDLLNVFFGPSKPKTNTHNPFGKYEREVPMPTSSTTTITGNETEPFFFIVGVGSSHPVTTKYATHDQAEVVARRMTEQHGTVFFVGKTVGKTERQTVVTTNFVTGTVGAKTVAGSVGGRY